MSLFSYFILCEESSSRKIRSGTDDENHHFEGDILGVTSTPGVAGVQSSATTSVDKKWPGGLIPYQITSEFSK